MGKTPDDNNTLDTEVLLSLKYLNNFCIFLDLPLINGEIELDLSRLKECIIPEILVTPRAAGDNPVAAIQTTGATV